MRWTACAAAAPPTPSQPIPSSSNRPFPQHQARLQNPGSEFKSTWQVLQQTLRHEGAGGLYRGLGTVVSIGTPAFVLYLATYEQAKRTLCDVPALEHYQFVGHFAAGMAAETVSCLVYVPVDVIKERLQVQRRLRTGQEISGSLPMYRGTWHALATIMETEGLRGVYRVRWGVLVVVVVVGWAFLALGV